MHALLPAPAVERNLSLWRFKPALHAADVAAGTERLSAASQDEGLDRIVTGDRFERADELATHIVAHCITPIRAVEGDRRNAGVNGKFDQLKGHGKACA